MCRRWPFQTPKTSTCIAWWDVLLVEEDLSLSCTPKGCGSAGQRHKRSVGRSCRCVHPSSLEARVRRWNPIPPCTSRVVRMYYDWSVVSVNEWRLSVTIVLLADTQTSPDILSCLGRSTVLQSFCCLRTEKHLSTKADYFVGKAFLFRFMVSFLARSEKKERRERS